MISAWLPTSNLRAAPFPGPHLVRVSTNLTGVSTWPGYRRPAFITDMDVQGNRVALAGSDLGALLIERQESGARTVRRFISPTISSSGSSVAIQDDYLFVLDGSRGHIFELSSSSAGSASFPNRSYNGHVGIEVSGNLAVSWNHSDAYVLSSQNPLQSLSIATNRFPNASVNSIQLCEAGGHRLQVAYIAPSSTPARNAYLQTWALMPNSPLLTNELILPFKSEYAGEPEFSLSKDGRIAVKHLEPDKVMLFQISVSGNVIRVEQTATLTTDRVGLTRLALDGDTLAVFTGDSLSGISDNSIALYDVSDYSVPRKVGALPLPTIGRYGIAGHMMIQGESLYYADPYAAYFEADISNPANPRWIYEDYLTGNTTFVAHNGPLVLAAEAGVYGGLRLVNIGDGSTPTTLHQTLLSGSIQACEWNRHVAYVQAPSDRSAVAAIDFATIGTPHVVRRATDRATDTLRTRGLSVDEALLVTADRLSGLDLYSLEIPGYPMLRARVTGQMLGLRTETFESVTSANGYVYTVYQGINNAAGLVVIDARNPSSPQVIRTIKFEHHLEQETLTVEGNRLWNLRYSFPTREIMTVQCFDLSDPAQPALIGSMDGGLSNGRAIAHGNFLIRHDLESSQNTPWNNSSHYEFQINELKIASETGLQMGQNRLAEVLLRTWDNPVGRKISGGLPRVVGDLLVLPIGQDGFDVVRADFLPRKAPVIKHQPKALKVAVGRRAVLSATVDGMLPLAFQWFKGEQPLTNSANLTGVDSLFLVIPKATPGDAGTYSLRVGNAAGDIVSRPATLEVVVARPLTLQLESIGDNAWRGHVTGDPGQVVRVEWSNDLVIWTADETTGLAPDIPLVEGTGAADLKQRSGKQRFYRAVVVYPN